MKLIFFFMWFVTLSYFKNNTTASQLNCPTEGFVSVLISDLQSSLDGFFEQHFCFWTQGQYLSILKTCESIFELIDIMFIKGLNTPSTCTGYSQLTARVGTKLCRRINENGGYVNSNLAVLYCSENLNPSVHYKSVGRHAFALNKARY